MFFKGLVLQLAADFVPLAGGIEVPNRTSAFTVLFLLVCFLIRSINLSRASMVLYLFDLAIFFKVSLASSMA